MYFTFFRIMVGNENKSNFVLIFMFLAYILLQMYVHKITYIVLISISMSYAFVNVCLKKYRSYATAIGTCSIGVSMLHIG